MRKFRKIVVNNLEYKWLYRYDDYDINVTHTLIAQDLAGGKIKLPKYGKVRKDIGRICMIKNLLNREQQHKKGADYEQYENNSCNR